MILNSFSSISLAIASSLVLGTSLIPRSAMAQADPELLGTVWELQQIQYNNDTVAVPQNPANYTIEFLEDGNLAVRADCNFVRGTYDLESPDFITLGPSTLAACPPDSIDDEYRRGLEDAVNYFFRGDDMYMDMPADAGTLHFAAAPVAEEPPAEEPPETPAEATPPPATSAPAPAEPVRGLW
ncbi:MAG TPA: META domain-containing protein [Candidatus Obscuribacterales bacterium]